MGDQQHCNNLNYANQANANQSAGNLVAVKKTDKEVGESAKYHLAVLEGAAIQAGVSMAFICERHERIMAACDRLIEGGEE